MNQAESISRRSVLKAASAGVVSALATPLVAAERTAEPNKGKGRIKQSVCRWCYGKIPLDKLAEAVVKMGYKSIELLSPQDYKVTEPYGLTCAMLSVGCKIESCLNRPENHEQIEKLLRDGIDFAAAEGLPNVICFSGNRKGMPDDEGLKNCATGLKRIVGYAEQKQVTICMELLNSKVNHKDYMCDRTPWGVELCKAVGSPRFKLLYDIYHMQIMEGDVIHTIQQYKEYLAHFHTGGVPGRHEIDVGQELQYPAIMRAIAETGYQGYVGQEFIPARDPLTSLAEAFAICDV